MQTRKEFVYEQIFNAGYTIKDFSKISGVTEKTFRTLNDKKLRESTLIKIAKGLGDPTLANKIYKLPGKEAKSKN